MRHMTPQQLADYLAKANPAPLLLDVREPWEYQICRVEDSVLIPMPTIPQACQKLDAARETVVICHHGVRSRAVASYLEQAGFTNVVNLSGGVAAWAREVDPKMPVY
ncbi:MAG: rhodanese-like domain-containing protein [Gammaproteobacteria bacterium]